MADSSRKFAVALVTAPDLKTARRLANVALAGRLAACANLIRGIESHYWWGGRIERGREVLILFKTTRRSLRNLEKLVIEEHPYDTPEFVVLSIDAGNKRYLRWCEQAVGQ